MKIEMHLPRSFDADVEYDPTTRVVTIKPTAVTRGVVPLIGVRTIADKDESKVKTSMINFDLGTGEPTIATKRQQKAGKTFDEPDGVPAEEKK